MTVGFGGSEPRDLGLLMLRRVVEVMGGRGLGVEWPSGCLVTGW